jgi:adenosylcobinamide-GDP ribazoletransferase
MQDSRLGTFGAVALFLMLISKYQTLNLINATLVPLLLVAGHALSRLSTVWIMATANYVKATGKSKPLATEIKKSHLLLANFFGLLPFIVTLVLLEYKLHSTLLVLKYVLMTLFLVLLSWYWWRSKIIKNIDGYTGDTLGATQQITELAFYLSALACGI